jgi:hypothetical protein
MKSTCPTISMVSEVAVAVKDDGTEGGRQKSGRKEGK